MYLYCKKMSKITIYAIGSVVLFFSFFLFGEKVAVLSEISKPAFDFFVDGDQLFITQCATIYIYSLKDFKLQKNFGQRGEGPREFKVHTQEHVYVSVQPDFILVGSGGKISFFSRDGRFKEEIRNNTKFGSFTPLDGNYIGYSNENEGKKRYTVVNILDSNFKKIKEVCRGEHSLQKKTIALVTGTFHYKVYNDNIYVVYWDGEFLVDCFGKNGDFKFSLKNENFKRRKVNVQDRERIHKWCKFYWKDWYHKNKHRIKINEYWPAIGTFFVDGSIIYISTYVRQKDDWLFYLYDLKGNYLQKIYLPLYERNVWAPYPYSIKNGKLYQIIENEETEKWELHITRINPSAGPSARSPHAQVMEQ